MENGALFYRTYLRELDEARRNLPRDTLLVGISVDTFEECKELKNKLGLGYDLIPDETLIMRELLNVTTGKGHGKEAYLQPSMFMFKDGANFFEWIQEPKLLNLGGAIGRLPIERWCKKLLRFLNGRKRAEITRLRPPTPNPIHHITRLGFVNYVGLICESCPGWGPFGQRMQQIICPEILRGFL